MSDHKITRRSFVARCAGAAAVATVLPGKLEAGEPESHQATGIRVGEVTDTSAIVWVRRTAASDRNNRGEVVPGRAQDFKHNELPKAKGPVESLEGACPGAPGRVRLQYATDSGLKDAKITDWVEVNAEGDFIHQFALKGLKADTIYFYLSETAQLGGSSKGGVFGQFRTAPAADIASNLVFCVMTCQGYPDRGHPDGHAIYPSMQALKPAFACLTGDLVYYDNDMPRAMSPDLARYHWQRMFSLPRLVDFNRQVPTYWLKDDHDTLNNDSWPGMDMGELTFAEGQKIFRQQAPLAEGPTYRTFRWGRDLQIWLVEGRDYRSPNEIPDGPDKTIWGKEQKEWFERTVKESNAKWKVLVSPTPLVGPDRGGKNDNLANKGFLHEGNELRAWLKANTPDNFFIICGDRHWQYHSVHPEFALNEFCPGPASDEHAEGSPGYDAKYHQYHRVAGGFLSVTLVSEANKSRIVFRHHNVNGEVGYEWGAAYEVKA